MMATLKGLVVAMVGGGRELDQKVFMNFLLACRRVSVWCSPAAARTTALAGQFPVPGMPFGRFHSEPSKISRYMHLQLLSHFRSSEVHLAVERSSPDESSSPCPIAPRIPHPNNRFERLF